MGSKMDDMKGRAKEAAGSFTGDKDMEREGKFDQAGAAVKDKVQEARDKADELIDKAKDKFNR